METTITILSPNIHKVELKMLKVPVIMQRYEIIRDKDHKLLINKAEESRKDARAQRS